MPLLGLAGIAEAALAVDSGLLCIGVYATITLACVGLLFRSRIATALCALGGIVTTVLFQPWEFFRFEPSDDPDVQSWQAEYRFLAWWWVVAVVGALTACVDAYQCRARRRRDDRSHVEPSAAPAPPRE